MLPKQVESNVADDNSELDEGWWASVLSDEVVLAEPVKDPLAKTYHSHDGR